MRVFVTGASGFIGSAVVAELLGAGHQVIGLARSEASAAAVAKAGAEVLRGDLEDLDSLRAGTARSDGVIHLAFIHDFSRFEESARVDERAIATLGAALEGSNRPLVIASGVLGLKPGQLVTERDEPDPSRPGSPRQAGARTAAAFAKRGVRSSIVRLPPSVHDRGDHGFVPRLIEVARSSGRSGYVGDGAARWPAVHRLDAARLFRLALEKAPAGAVLHGTADEGVPTRAIAEVIARHLALPLESIPAADAVNHFGWLGPLLSLDSASSSKLTQEQLDWHPSEAGLLADLDAGHYFA